MHRVSIDIALRWSADAERNHDSIDIALLWSENQTTKEHLSRLVIERKTSYEMRESCRYA